MLLASRPIDTDYGRAVQYATLLSVDVHIAVQGVTLASLGHTPNGSKTWPLAAPLGFAHLVDNVDIIGQPMPLAPQRLPLHCRECGILPARHGTARIASLAHPAQSPGIAVGKVGQTVSDPRHGVHEARSAVAVLLATPSPIGVHVPLELM